MLRIPRRGWPRAFTRLDAAGAFWPCRMGRRTRTPSSGTAGASLSSAIPASRAPGSACGCIASGADVAGLSLPPPTEPSLFALAGLSDLVPTRYGDIRDLETVRAAFRELQPDIVFHLAAQPLVRRSYREPVETYATNVMGTVHVLEAVRSVPSVRGVIVVTSDKCYENREWPWAYRETEAMGGHDPVQQLQGLRRTGDRGVPAIVLLPTTHRRCHRARRQRDRRWRLGRGPAAARLHAGARRRARPSRSAIRTPCGRGSTCWNRCAATCCWPNDWTPMPPAFGDAWNFGPADQEARPVGVDRLTHRRAVGRWRDAGATHRGDAPHEAAALKVDAVTGARAAGLGAAAAARRRAGLDGRLAPAPCRGRAGTGADRPRRSPATASSAS